MSEPILIAGGLVFTGASLARLLLLTMDDVLILDSLYTLYGSTLFNLADLVCRL